ncbi:MAG: ribosome biogenesis GTPase Der [Akkermansia sp.]|nr:ribosome biogenesis GTPase Der [Akkermansia sp.]
MSCPTIAIVGRPNVGKSAIFNRMVGRRIAIVHDQPGVTRDRLCAPVRITDFEALAVDTGGIGSTLDDGFAAQVAREADIALNAADYIMFVCDCRDHLTPIDKAIAAQLHKSSVPVLLVLNKADTEKQELNLGEFTELGFADYVFTSAAHGRGFHQLASRLNAALKKLGADTKQAEAAADAAPEEEPDREEVQGDSPIRVAIVGKPNAGKSSLVNAILNDRRTIVSEVAGTTRDAIDIPYSHNGNGYVLIDTAGMRPRSKRDTSVEVFSAMRSEKAIRRADICLLVIDMAAGVTQQDRRIGSIIAKESKPCIIIVNKFDLYCPEAPMSARKDAVKEHISENLFFLDYAPVSIVSAKQGTGLEGIFKAIQRVKLEARNMPGTGELNRLLQRAMEMNPPGQHRVLKKRLKLYYATTALNEKYTTIPVPTYVLFVNDKRLLPESYAQYLRNAIRKRIKAAGVPIVLSPRSRVRNAD